MHDRTRYSFTPMAKRDSPSRREFLAGSAAATAATAATVATAAVGCATPNESAESTDAAPQGPRPRDPAAAPHTGYVLPGREEVFQPPGWGPATRKDWKGKNVIVLMLDSFRWDHCSAYGDSVVPTPNLKKFADESTFFTHAYPEGLPTVPVRTSLHTGRFTYPFRRWQTLYPQDHPLLAEILWSEGFHSALVSDVYHLHKPSYAFDRGFDEVVWLRGQESDPFVRDPKIRAQVDVESHHKRRGPEDRGGVEQVRTYLANRHDWKSEDDHFTPRVIGTALDWLQKQERKENLFLWVDNFCPHEPWDPPDRWLKKAAPNFDFSGKKLICPTPGDVEGYLTSQELDNSRQLYQGVAMFVDYWVGRFFDELKRMGLYENSLIILATDHGEPFGDHGIVRKARPWPYEELAKTFLMIRDPSGDGVQRVDSYVQLTDMTATILDYLTIDKPAHMTSESLLPLIRNQEEKIRDEAVCCHYNASVSIRHEDWSYIHWIGENAVRAKGSKLTKSGPELYNLIEDPHQRTNLYAAEPDRARDMDRRMRQFTERLVRRET